METAEQEIVEIEILERLRKKSLELRNEPLSNRRSRLKKLEKWMLNNRKRIQEAVFKDFRKPSEEADLSELFPAMTEVKDAIRNLRYWAKPKTVSNSLTYLGTEAKIVYEPKGFSLIISPWNYPFNLTLGPVISAIAAGNTFVIKPSEYTPNTSQLLSEMCQEVFADNICHVFQGDAQVSQKLLEYPFDNIFFTGSPQVGKIVMEAASKNLTSVTLELGGKSPTIVDESSNLKDAAEKIAWGKWLNAGQTCVAPDYLYVHESVANRFLELLEEKLYQIYGNSENYTGIVNEKHYQRLNDMISNAIDKGASVKFNTKNIEEERKMGATVMVDVPMDCDIMQEEIFGPILPVLTFKNLDDVIEVINSKPKPLSLYVFSRRKKTINRITTETSAGSMCVNDCTLQFAHPNLPFGGVNFSGIGKGHGYHGFLAFTNEKSYLKQRIGLTMVKTLYPPFTGFKKTVLDLLIKYF